MTQPKPQPLEDKFPPVNGYNYKNQYGVIVVCKDEDHQKQVYDQLKQDGHKCKVVVV